MKGWSVLVAGVKDAGPNDAGRLLDGIRARNPGVHVQAADAQAVYGRDHVLGVLKIVFEALERGVMIANRPEAEALLRLACTDQIEEAIRRAGLKSGRAGCFIAFSREAGLVLRLGEQLAQEFALDDSVIEPGRKKRTALAKRLGIKAAGGEFVDGLLERAAIMVKD